MFAGAKPVKGAPNLGSQASHLASVERQLGRKIAVAPKAKDGGQVVETRERELPVVLAYVWDWFHELAARRTSGMALNPITHADVLAWSRLTDRDVTPWEVHLLLRLDDTALASLREK